MTSGPEAVRQLLVIGIGAGDPDHVTVQAVKAMRTVDVFFLIDKGDVKGELVDLRRAIVAEHVADHPHRFVEIHEPDRDRETDAYVGAVADWHEARSVLLQQAIADELGAGGVGALLVWGDPMLYDSALRVVDRMLERGAAFEHRVIPGITSPQTLCAQHRIPINRIGEAIHITPGRRLKDTSAADLGNCVVMLDAHCAFLDVPGDLHIYWGAYLGTPDEILLDGLVSEVGETIRATRAEARERKGWIMDTYLLRRPL